MPHVSLIVECHILRADDVDRCDAVKAYLDPSEPDVLSLRVQSKDTRLRSNMLIRKVSIYLYGSHFRFDLTCLDRVHIGKVVPEQCQYVGSAVYVKVLC